jgi:CarD family transcriptional regulator, regulator of rRNA transcription
MVQKKTTSAKAKATTKTKSHVTASSKSAASPAKTKTAGRSSASSRSASSKTSTATKAKTAGAGRKAVAASAASSAQKSAKAKKPTASKSTKTTIASQKSTDALAAAKPARTRKAAAKPTASSVPKKATAVKAKPESATAKAAKKTTKVAAASASPKAVKRGSAAKAKREIIAPPPAVNAVVASGATARAVAASIAEAAARKISSPVKPVKTPKGIAENTAAKNDAMQQKKSVSQRHGFKTNEHVVYPAHGVGRIIGIEEQEIAGMSLELFVINFEKEKLTLRVPTGKLESVGLRKLAEGNIVDKALDVLKGRARVKRTMWSRRAQEYVAKINSGDLIAIAEVVRDLYRSEAQPEQSYSERQLYEDALDRMSREVAAVFKLDERGAIQRITDVLSKSARNRRAADEEASEADSESTQAA